MRAVVQRVSRASVTVDGSLIGSIGPGLCVLLGVTHDDGEADVSVLAAKLAGLRIFPDDDGLMNRSVVDVVGGVLVVSQFTLYGETARGRRPSFTKAAPPEVAAPLIDSFVRHLRSAGLEVATGRFGASMEVDLVNQGPVTILLETAAGRLL
jgi:D-aminoacyl-tRNA deacylase